MFYRGKIIEFQRDVFHANPSLFSEGDKPHPYNQLTSKEIRIIDKNRFLYYNDRGYKVLEIWENDYKNDPDGV